MDSSTVSCECGTDPRLAPGIAAIACHVAKRADWDTEAQDRVATSTELACRAAFGLVGCNASRPAQIRVASSSTHDRIEVSVEFAEEVPTNKIKALAEDESFKLAHYETVNAHCLLKFVELRDARRVSA